MSAIPELVKNGVTGYIVEPGNREQLLSALRNLVSDPVTAYEMGQAGRRYIKEISDSMTNCLKMADIFIEAAEKR